MPITIPSRIDEVLTRGVDTLIEREHLRTRMLSGEQLRIKFGIDPTSPHMHLGHTVPLRKLRQFQDLGHVAVLIIGDYTATIGDPTGRSEERKRLTLEEINTNKATYIEQAAKILDIAKTEIHHNGEWFNKMSALDFLQLTSLVSFQQVMQRDDFRKRMEDPDHPLSVLEITYPLMQGYDSVMIKADVEIGGNDQLLNLHMGRRLQRRYGMPEQDLLTVTLLEGTDGERKMSKSFGNAIPLQSSPTDMYGLTMSIPDSCLSKYFRLVTDLSAEEIITTEASLAQGENPKNIKMKLAWNLVRMFHNPEDANQAQDDFVRRFSEHAAPETMPELTVALGDSLADVLVKAGFATSKTNAKDLIDQGGVSLDTVTVTDVHAKVDGPLPQVLQKGKRFFVRLVS